MSLQMMIPSAEYDAYSEELEKLLKDRWIENEKANEPCIETFIEDLEQDKRIGIVVGAGYTLEKNIEVLKTLDQKKYCLIACDKAVPKLIPFWKPDYVVSLNVQETKEQTWDIGTGCPAKWLNFDSRNTKLVMPITVHPSTYRNWKGEKIWLLPSNVSKDLKEEWVKKYDQIPIYRGTNSGFFALLTAGIIGLNPIALTAINLCAKGTGPFPRIGEYRLLSQDPFGEIVNTTIEWFSARTEFLELIERLKRMDSRVFNCSEGGILYVPGLGLPLAKFAEIERIAEGNL